MNNIIKIVITSLILLMFSNIGACDTYEWSESGGSQESYSLGGDQTSGGGDHIHFIVRDCAKFNDVTTYHEIIDKSDWQGGGENSKYNSVIYKIGAVQIGTGLMGWNKAGDYVYLNAWIDWDLSAFSGAQTISIINVPNIDTGDSRICWYDIPVNTMALCSDGGAQIIHSRYPKVVQIDYDFTNYIYTNPVTTDIINMSINKMSDSSKYIICDGLNNEVLNETSCNTVDIDLMCFNETIYVYAESEYGDILNYQYSYVAPDVSRCRIETEDIEIGDSINVSYYNINDVRNNPLKYGNSDYATCDINIQILVDRGYFKELIYQDLIIDESDTTLYYSSDSLTPGTYYAQINKNLGGVDEYACRTTFIISEPLNYSITVNPDNVYVGDKINLIYKSLNTSTLSVYDDNDKLIDNWLNIQGQSQKVYQVPPDYEYNNAYSNWYVMLNDTGNSSNNLRYNFTVNWKVYVKPEPTPEPTEAYFNESIEENIEELKDGINPVLELIFGISTIFVENPDYNKDNIVDVNELSTWINSIVSIAIVIFLFILYKVYKRR